MFKSIPTLIPGRHRRIRLISAVAVGAGLTLTACGNASSAKPSGQQSVGQSLSKVSTQSLVGVRISLGLSAAQIEQLSAGSGSAPTNAQAQAISQGAIFFSEQSGHGEALNSSQAANDKDNAFDFGLQIGNDTPVELRYVGQSLYLRVQASTLLSDVGTSASQASSFENDLRQGDTYVPGLSALGAGNWVQISSASLQSLSGLLKQYSSSLGASASAANPAQARSMVSKLRTDVGNAIKSNSTTQKLGTKDGRTEYQLTLNVQPFLTQVGPLLQSDLSSLPGGVGAKYADSLNQAKSQLPANQTAVIDTFVSGNKLDEVDVDLSQFAKKKPGFPVPLRINLASPPAIRAPSGATALDLSKLPSLIAGLAGGLGGSSASSSSASTS